jgi:hypothetical protein
MILIREAEPQRGLRPQEVIMHAQESKHIYTYSEQYKSMSTGLRASTHLWQMTNDKLLVVQCTIQYD